MGVHWESTGSPLGVDWEPWEWTGSPVGVPGYSWGSVIYSLRAFVVRVVPILLNASSEAERSRLAPDLELS
jgi:hypothetical protein